MTFPDGFLQELKLRNPLDEVVSRYVPLRRAGSNKVGCCPFHSEKTPSFTVYTQDPHFYCYGCGAGGDVITFVMRIENLDYLGAVEFLADRAGMPMPALSPGEKRVDKKRFYEMNAAAARFWHKNLFTPEGKTGLAYLTGRGLNVSVIRRFGLGYAFDRYDALAAHLLKEGYRPEEMKEAFLCGIGKNGKPFDYFRNRVIFPVIDVSGNVVAFSGRFVGDTDQRKYFNTNDTPVYKKSRHLFALNLAKNSPEKSLVLCEGNMDAVSLHANGVTNAVASLGTALSSEMCRLAARYTDEIYLCYDSDKAGVAATKKAIRLLSDAGVKVKIVTLEGTRRDGKPIKDPDDYIRTFGKAGFDERLKKAKPPLEYLFSLLEGSRDLSDMDGKNAFVKDAVELLSEVDSPVEKELFINRVADLTGLPAALIRTQIDQRSARDRAAEQREEIDQEVRESRGFGGKNSVTPEKARFLSRATKEEAIVGILLLRKEYLSDPAIRPGLDPSLFSCALYKKALETMLELTENGAEFDPAALNEVFTPDEIGELERLRRARAQIGTNTPDLLRELFLRLREEWQKKEDGVVPLSAEWLLKLREQKKGKEV